MFPSFSCICTRPTRHNITTTKSNPTCPYQHKHPRDPHPERLNHSRTTPPGLNPKSIRMTTTIGMSYEDLRPQAVRPKKSFFQRLNDTHDQLISHMRSLKEDPVLSVKQGERTRASSTTSLTSTPESDRENSQDAARTTEIDNEDRISSGFLSPPLSPVVGSFFPIQQFLLPRDRKPS